VDAAGNVIVSRPPPSAKQLIALVSRELIPFGKAATIAAILRHGGYSCVVQSAKHRPSGDLVVPDSQGRPSRQSQTEAGADRSRKQHKRRYLAAQLLLRAVSRASRVVNYLQAFASAQTRS
jgi:hypothetical protein